MTRSQKQNWKSPQGNFCVEIASSWVELFKTTKFKKKKVILRKQPINWFSLSKNIIIKFNEGRNTVNLLFNRVRLQIKAYTKN